MTNLLQNIIDIELSHLYKDLEYIDSNDLFRFQEEFDNAKTNKEKIKVVYDCYLKYDDDSIEPSIVKIWVAYGVIDSFQKALDIELNK